MPTQQPLDWWLERLDGIIEVTDGYMASCPAHEDAKPSLHLTIQGDSPPLVHCFAGCAFEDIVGIIDEDTPEFQHTTRAAQAAEPASAPRSASARAWWEQYTHVPADAWTRWGVRFEDQQVTFTWEGASARKHRQAGTKNFSWSGPSARPPLWPDIPDTPGSVIWLTEGESDFGPLRHVGFPTYALMKGANPKKDTFDDVWKALYGRGVRTVVFVLDADAAGRAGFALLRAGAIRAGLNAFYADLTAVLDPLRGETDVRDFWTRVQNPEVFKRAMLSTVRGEQVGPSKRVLLQELLVRNVRETPWLVKGVILAETVQMIVGSPKRGKSWLSLDMGISIATGADFLGEFPTVTTGPVVYISKEDPDFQLQDRAGKVLEAKGLGGAVDAGARTVQLPPDVPVPLYLDLTHEFEFTEARIAELYAWLDEIYQRHGQIACVIFDPLLRMIPAGTDEYKASDIATTVFGTAEKIRERYAAAVVLVHHRAKSIQEAKTSYGSIAFHAFSGGTLYLLGDPDENDGWIKVRGEYKSAPETTWAYRFKELDVHYEVEVEHGNPTPTRSGEVLDLVYDAVMAGEAGRTVEDLCDMLPSLSDTQIREALKTLESEGTVKREKEVRTPGVRRVGKPRDLWKVTTPGTQVIDFSTGGK